MTSIIPLPDKHSPTCGFVYVATGEKYLAEAVRSVQSLRKTNPGFRVCLFTDRHPPSGLFDDVNILPHPKYGFADKLVMADAPYDRVIFLDTDTLILDDISSLFDLLDNHDIAIKTEVFPGWDYSWPGVPDAFAELTTGLIVYRRSPLVSSFFVDWATKYFQMSESNPRFVPDQPSFRIALYQSNLRHCSIPTEYHLQADQGGYLFWAARVIHSRNNPEEIAREVNRVLGPRVFSLSTGTIPIRYKGLRNNILEWTRYNLRFFRQLWASVFSRGRKV